MIVEVRVLLLCFHLDQNSKPFLMTFLVVFLVDSPEIFPKCFPMVFPMAFPMVLESLFNYYHRLLLTP